MPQAEQTWLYLIAHDGETAPTTHINYGSDAFAALDMHNSGSERETKKSAGHWRLLLLIFVPHTRTLDPARLVQYWRRQRPDVAHRLMFGIRMAAELMLLCFVADAKPLHDAATKDKASRGLLEKVLRQIDVNNTAPLDREFVQQRVTRYLHKPSVVYLQRRGRGDAPLVDNSGTVSADFLNEINTIKRHRGRAVCFSKRTITDDTPDVDDNEESDEDEVQHPVRHGTVVASRAKRAKKSMTIVNGLVGLQQSAAFNDSASAVDAQTVLHARMAPPAVKSAAASAGARRRQRNSLFTAQGAVDSKTLRQYGDALCVDMRSSNTLANMKVSDGQNDRRCVCGTPRTVDRESMEVVLMPQAKPLRAYRCDACGRLSAAYERYYIDSMRATRAFKRPADVEAAESENEEISASNDSLDLFVQTLLVSFNNDGGEMCSPTTVRANAEVVPRARKRLFGSPPRPVAPQPYVAPESMLVYGNRTVSCRHASLPELTVPSSDRALIRNMFTF